MNTQPIIMPILGKESGDRWRLCGYMTSQGDLIHEDWSYNFSVDGQAYKLIVPLGFEMDGASVPRSLQSIVKMGGREMPDEAWLPHDFIYSKKGKGLRGFLFRRSIVSTFSPVPTVNRKFADKMFKNELNNSVHGLSKFKAPLAYAGVRIGGSFFWNRK